jgi:serine phosphatase RsbU (regulator of sigma subunit)/Tfp pilus assembly protein PilF
LEKYPPKTEYTLSDTSKVRVLNALSDKLWHQSEFDKAIIYANEARVICERLLPTAPADQKTKLINLYSSALGNIGVANDFQGKYPEALRFFFECLKLNESIENKDGIATALNNIGIIYYEQRDFEKALKYYNDALKIQEAIGDKQAISFSLNNIGLVYSDMNKIDKALEYYSKSLKLKEAANDKRGIVSALLNISGVYAQNEEYEKTLEYQFKALEVNREVNNKSDDAKLLNNIGKVYLLQKNYAKAIEYCEKAILISREIGVLEEILETEKNLSDIYAESGNPAKAFEHYKAFITARDSLFNVENTKDIVRSEMNFDFEKKQAIAKAEQEKKDAINAEELKQQRMQRNYFIIGFILMIALALFIFKGYTEKKKANTIIAEQKAIVEEKNKDITDSINYAKRIQTAILPSIDSIQLHLPQSFVFYQPKDIVSGDFYWFTEKENRLIFAVADCTGHGVPGAFMSMIGNDMLTQIIIEKGFLEPGQILTRLHEGVKNALKQDIGAGETKDGMDIALISIHKNSNIVEYAGALRPLWLIKPSVQEVTEYKADKHSIGGSASAEERTFTNHVIPFSEGDSIYLSTDGYADQFGGEKGKKYMTKNMKNLLLKIQNKNMNEQKTLVRQSFMEWKKDRSQVDDILVVGIRL